MILAQAAGGVTGGGGGGAVLEVGVAVLEVGVAVAAADSVGAVGAGVGAAVSGDNEPSSVILISGRPLVDSGAAGAVAVGGTKLAICSLISAFSWSVVAGMVVLLPVAPASLASSWLSNWLRSIVD